MVVAVAIKVVGVLLITALLIIPAASARPLCNTPERMAVVALIFGLLATFVGLGLSYQFDTPTGPTIVAVAALYFVLANIKAGFQKMHHSVLNITTHYGYAEWHLPNQQERYRVARYPLKG